MNATNLSTFRVSTLALLNDQQIEDVAEALYWHERWLLRFMTDSMCGRPDSINDDALMRNRVLQDDLRALKKEREMNHG